MQYLIYPFEVGADFTEMRRPYHIGKKVWVLLRQRHRDRVYTALIMVLTSFGFRFRVAAVRGLKGSDSSPQGYTNHLFAHWHA